MYKRQALFIGDSLSQGFALYAPTRDVATVCAYKSTSPNQVLQMCIRDRYRTRCFLEFTIRGVDVDVMAGFVILENGQEHDLSLIHI